MQLGQLHKIEGDLKKLGYTLIAISPDRPEKLRETLGKEELEGLSYRLLSDSRMKAARAYGISFRVGALTLTKYKAYGIDLEDASGEDHHELPVPSVFLVDEKGTIRFVYFDPDYKTRIEPDKLLGAAKEAAENPENGK